MWRDFMNAACYCLQMGHTSQTQKCFQGAQLSMARPWLPRACSELHMACKLSLKGLAAAAQACKGDEKADEQANRSACRLACELSKGVRTEQTKSACRFCWAFVCC
jgi:hypothetical protein